MKKPQRKTLNQIEWEYVEQLIQGLADGQIKNMVANNLRWYLIRAKRYKLYSYILNITNIMAPMLIVIINILFDEKGLVGQIAIAVTGTITTALSACADIYEKRILYRKAVEDIKSESFLYLNRVGRYKGETRDEAYAKKILAIVGNVNSKWQELEEKGDKISQKDKAAD